MSRHVDHMSMVRLLDQDRMLPGDDEVEQLDLDRNLAGIVAWAYTNLRQCKCPLGDPSVEFNVASTHQHNDCARGIYLRVIDNLRRIAPDDAVRDALTKAGARPGARYNPPDRHEAAASEIRQAAHRTRRNMDDRRRRAERAVARDSSDVSAGAKVLSERLRSGELTREQIVVAARLGDPRAQLLEPTATPEVWNDYGRSQLIEAVARAIVEARRVTRRIGEPDEAALALSYAIDCAEAVLPLWGGPGDDRRLRRAIEAGTRVLAAIEAGIAPGDDIYARQSASEASRAAGEAVSAASAVVAASAEQVAHAVVAVVNGRGDIAYRPAAFGVEFAAQAAYLHGGGKGFDTPPNDDRAGLLERGKALTKMQERLAAYALGEVRSYAQRRSPG